MVECPMAADRMVRSAVAVVAALCGLGIAGSEARADSSRVGLVVATRVNLTEAEADKLASQLGDAVREQLEVDVIAGLDARRRLPPGGIADDCVAQPDCVRDVASRLDGDELLFLFMVRIGPRVQIDVTWSDPDIGQAASRSVLVMPAAGGPEAERALAGAPRRFLPHASPRSSPVSSEPLVVSQPIAVERGRRLTAPAVVSGVISVAALGTGVGFALSARNDYDELEKDGCHRMACQGAGGRIDRMEKKALTADILFATAGVAAATSLILYLTSGGSEERVPVEVGAAPTQGGALLSFGGAF
jgi:hypothetical protein